MGGRLVLHPLAEPVALLAVATRKTGVTVALDEAPQAAKPSSQWSSWESHAQPGSASRRAWCSGLCPPRR
jgi:hypothetical protein